jgi:glutamyl-tRNA reductase
VAIGLNHRTAPVGIRERLAMPPELVGTHLKALIERGYAKESVILSTCNRVEIYALVDSVEGGVGIQNYLSSSHSSGLNFESYFYQHRDEEAVRHLFRVASSLDSLVLGEPQILGQLKEAYELALEQRSAGRVLGRVMRRAISVAKKVRTDTAIGSAKVSVGSAGVALAEQVLGTLEGRLGLVLGAGDLAELVAHSFRQNGLGELVVVNRTYERAEVLAEKVGASAVPYDQLERYLQQVDVAVTSAASQRAFLTQESLGPVMRARRYRPLFILDLAVPRNVSPEVNAVEGVYLFNIDDLQELSKKGHRQREEEALVAETMVRTEAARCFKGLDSLNAGPLISAMMRRGEEIVSIEHQRTHKVLSQLDSGQRKAVEEMSRSLIKRMLHDPILLAKHLAEEGRLEDLGLLAESFGVELSGLQTQEVPLPGEEDPS